MGDTAKPFLPLERRARVAIVFFWIFIAAAALFALCLVLALAQGINMYTDAELEFEGVGGTAVALLMVVAGIVFAGDFLVCIVVFLMWLYRARRNLPSLGVIDARWSPGWAIGWWFVPIMALFRPYQLVREVWQASDPTTSPGWRRDTPPGFFGWWWGLFLTFSIFGNVTDNFAKVHGGNPTLGTAAWLTAIDVLMLFAGIGAAWCAIRIMRDITVRQTQRHQVGAF